MQLYYFDWLDHKDGAKDRRTTSRIGAYVSDTIDNLLSRDVIRDKQTIIGYGKLDVGSFMFYVSIYIHHYFLLQIVLFIMVLSGLQFAVHPRLPNLLHRYSGSWWY
jgi:hypothetical protein